MEPSQPSSLSLISLQYELALVVGQGLELPLMLRRFFNPALKLLACRSVHVWRDTPPGEGLQHVFALPMREASVWEHKPGLADAAAALAPGQTRVEVPLPGHLVAHVWALPAVGRFVLVRDGQPLPETTLQAMEPIVARLATACLACLQYENAERLRQQAEAANVAKGYFLANMSHEIRTPIHGVIGLTELAREDCRDEAVCAHLDVALASAQHLLSVVNDILDFSKIEAGKVVLTAEPVQLQELVTSVLDSVRPVAQNKGLVLNADLSPQPHTVRVDRVRLRQVLFNLVGNAVKFTGQGQVTVSVHPVHPEADGVKALFRFAVEDTGIGIEQDKLAQVFESFSQADASTSRVYGGTGLGLTISRQLVAMMGGKLQVTSTVGQGSRFWFDLPLERVAALAPQAAAEGAINAPTSDLPEVALDVLVVDDVPANRLLMGTKLQRAGHRVVFAQDGAEALEKVGQQSFDLVFMDMQMPVMDGLMATQRIRQSEAASGQPPVMIVALTANVMPADEQRCLDAGMSGYMSKPFGREALAHWIGVAQQHKQEPGGNNGVTWQTFSA